MKEVNGDIWDFHSQGKWIVITTNGFVKRNGNAVMGRGTALQAKQKFPDIEKLLGESIVNHGNYVYVFGDYKIITFPVKHNWWENADFNLIEKSCKQLQEIVDIESIKEIYLPRPGCGNGKLKWEDVKPILEKYFDDRFIVVNN